MEDNIDFKKYSIQGRILSIVALFLTAFGILFMIIDRMKSDETIEIKSNEVKRLKTDLNSIEKTELKDSIKEINMKKWILNYTDFVSKKDISSILSYYNDTLENYFLKENVTKKEAKENLGWYFNKYPNSEVEYDTASIHISNEVPDTTIIIINGHYSRNNEPKTEFISKIKLDRKNKIVSLKDYLIK